MTSLLNIDDMVSVDRRVQYRGVKYRLADRSVESMLQAIATAQKVENSNDPGQFLESMIATVQAAMPECPAGVVRSMSIRELTAILEFINTSDTEVAQEASGAAEAEGESLQEGK